ncbi:hypothetical protein COCSUDRAFT_33788 [Coccomyxa subellipsoidea C-169]|uniref:Uncharacterized protein n=1 Tax=Coccomyxa subellipsoidea (strain C-169) TaxID=574566 RepID=I0YRS2_COCSC|nr:hypothetical protein COCSUDRAFT_33788 [Coccomyxa subellipsoidea C-169]EIE21091.1 hypothetical protein COCSUDRAFT_33788 [Coccomyxa subellipsoidea C-169]|eukprot:XP_005645635.1 hypothetical protein COCSUDRAFT_33788 [Coccomyxa subellipsoidea C-169]
MSVVQPRPATYSRKSSCKSTCHRQRDSAKSAHAPPQTSWASWTALGSVLLAAGPAIAEDGLKYEPGAGADVVKQVAGAAYVVLLAVFAVRLLTKRAKFATEERLASAAKGENERPPDPSIKRVTPLQSLWAAVQAGVFAYLLYLFSSNVDGYFERQPLPDQYTARNITVAISTIVRGLSYLITFIFGANAVGLSALTVQLFINPEAVNEAEPQQDLHDVSNNGQEGSSGDAL